jgi:ankyrin repeat protein
MEILLDIADQLDDSRLNTLANINSQIYQFLNKYLYRRDVTSVKSRSLTWAIRNRVEATIQRAIDAGRHLDPIPESFRIALQDATYRGHVSSVAALLKLDGINPNFFNPNGSPPLSVAALRGYTAIVELLLSVSNIDPNVRDRYGWTPLLRACLLNRASVVRQLLARDDIDVNTVGSMGGELTTPLLLAIGRRNKEIINLLLGQDGIDVNLHPEISSPPLLTAIRKGLAEVVESLFARDDLDLNIVNQWGDHLLLISVELGLGLDKV